MESSLGVERKCNNCYYYPCTRVDCKQDSVCDLHTFGSEKMMKDIDKLRTEGYCDFEGMR